MHIQWDQKVGPATIAAIVGAIGVIASNVWIASSTYRGLTDKIETQGSKIEEVNTASKNRFSTVRTAIDQSKNNQVEIGNRMTKLETGLSYIADQTKYLVQRLDGNH